MSLFKDYNKDKDYMEERNRAAARGDLKAAEQAERMRNYKIDREGLSYPKTYNYIDIGDEAKGLMQNNAPASVIGELMDARKNKANTNPQYQKYANDEIQDQMTRYYFNGISGVGGNYENRPTYQNKRQTTIDELWDNIVNAPSFDYNVESDPVYQSYKDTYTREGQRAMQDTLASLSIDAGGENSWAVSAAAQAQNRYMQELADKVPELYNLAYEKYLTERNNDMNKLALARDIENDDYNKFLNEMNIFQNDRAFANSLYSDYYNQSRADREFTQNSASQKLQQYIAAGIVPPDDVLQMANADKAYVEAMVKAVQEDNAFNKTLQDYELANLEYNKNINDLTLQDKLRELALASYNVPKGSYSGSGSGDDETKKTEQKKTETENDAKRYISQTSLRRLGLENVPVEEIEKRIENGELIAVKVNDKIVLRRPN